MTTANKSGETRDTRRAEPDLDRRYGRIAISALVAALPYGSESKPKTQTPVPSTPPKNRAA
jgi:hypothetical protein